MSDNKRAIGTSDMAMPQTMNYSTKYKFTNTFRNDLKTLVKELPYFEAKRILSVLDDNNNVLTAAIFNQFLRMLGGLPYKYISPLMNIIEEGDKEKLSRYFQKIEEPLEQVK